MSINRFQEAYHFAFNTDVAALPRQGCSMATPVISVSGPSAVLAADRELRPSVIIDTR